MGFLILDEIEYFYVFNNEYNRELFYDINRIKEYGNENAFLGNFSSRYLAKSGNYYFQDINSYFLSSNDFETKIKIMF